MLTGRSGATLASDALPLLSHYPPISSCSHTSISHPHTPHTYTRPPPTQCTTLHPVAAFDGAAKSCRASLERNRAQRKSRFDAAKAAGMLTLTSASSGGRTADDCTGGAAIAAGMRPLADDPPS